MRVRIAWLVLLMVAACGDDAAPATEGLDASTEGLEVTEETPDAAPQVDYTESDAQLVWEPPDAGQRPPPVRDAGTARQCLDYGEVLAGVERPRCAASTADCVADCMSLPEAEQGDCRDACLKNDPMPADPNGVACEGCVIVSLFDCIKAAGCEDAVAAMYCCFEDRCGTGSAEGCQEQRCGDELEAVVTCGFFEAPECLDFVAGPIASCYAGGDDDAGI